MTNTPTPTVSVVLCVFNGERFLQEQLDSILAQTHLPDELIACDDCSTDATPEILAGFALAAPFPTQVHRNERNLGSRDSYLRSARLCTGDYIAFADADDPWATNKLERLVEVVTTASRPVSVVAHSYDVVNANLQPIAPGPIRRKRRFPPSRVPLFDSYNGQTLFFARTLMEIPIDDHNRPEDIHHVVRPGALRSDPRMSQDKWILFLSALDRGLLLIPDKLTVYRQHGGNQSGASPRGITADIKRLRLADRDHYLRLARLARERADTLQHVASDPHASEHTAALARARSRTFVRFANSVEARSGLYEPRLRFWERVACWVKLIAKGSYRRQTSGGVGAKAAVKDLLISLVGSRLVSPLRTEPR